MYSINTINTAGRNTVLTSMPFNMLYCKYKRGDWTRPPSVADKGIDNAAENTALNCVILLAVVWRCLHPLPSSWKFIRVLRVRIDVINVYQAFTAIDLWDTPN